MLARRHLLFGLGGLLTANVLAMNTWTAMAGMPAGLVNPLPPSSPMAADGDLIAPPTAWFRLLRHHPELDPATSTFEPLQLTSSRAALLIKINKEINATIRYRADDGKDHWKVGGREGDCEDFAISKLAALTGKHGLPRGALTLAACRQPRGRGHAVLLLHSDRGVYVMDSLTPRVLPWHRPPYKWLAREEPGAPFRLWRSLYTRI